VFTLENLISHEKGVVHVRSSNYFPFFDAQMSKQKTAKKPLVSQFWVFSRVPVQATLRINGAKEIALAKERYALYTCERCKSSGIPAFYPSFQLCSSWVNITIPLYPRGIISR